MEIKEALLKRKENEAKIITKAVENDEFRAKLLKDPKAALEQDSGKRLPEGLQIRVIEEDPNTVTLVLPRKPDPSSTTEELSDEALEQVAGGAFIGLFGSVIFEGVF